MSSPKSTDMENVTNCPTMVSPDDLIQLNPVTIDNVLTCLERRYYEKRFYTRAGSTLVAVNPFQPVPALYSDLTMRTYEQDARTCAPHVYSVGDEARRESMHEYGPSKQSIIVSGESGAGKTETAKHLLKYLSSVCAGEHCGQVEQRILDANPILESFGNALTCRNDNSSRFGKYIQIELNYENEITGAQLYTYLLEKTRLVTHAQSEGNFHIFYQLLSGLEKDTRRSLFLEDLSAKDFLILRECSRSSANDASAFARVQRAMADIGIDQEKQMEIFKLLSAVLHLCNVTFTPDRDAEFISIDEKDFENGGSLVLACRLLGVNEDRIERSITSREITASHNRRKSVFYKSCTMEEATVRKQTLAKMIYARLFDWLVTYMNSAIQPKSSIKSIGILDIYGFECFNENSLEQLCINYANEKLQQHFVSSFLKELQEEYESEAVCWQRIDFIDNNKCLLLLESNTSILSLLNEECHLNRPTNDEAVYNRLHEALKVHADWSRPRCVQGVHKFVVRHYAGRVTYNVRGLVEKNKDNVPTEFVKLLRHSEKAFIRELFPEDHITLLSTSTPTKKQKTVLSKFKASLDSLMSTLRSSHCHYIRCVKPNASNAPRSFEAPYVVQQLTACGVTESVHICRNGYPSRLTYQEFLRRYGLLLRSENSAPREPRMQLFQDDDKENAAFVFKEPRRVAKSVAMDESLDVLYERQLTLANQNTPVVPKHKRRRRTCVSGDDHTRKCCATIMKLVFGARYTRDQQWTRQFGRTKLFLRDGELEEVEAAKTQALSNYAVRLQVAWRSRQVRKEFLRKRHSVIKLQAAVRGWLCRRRVESLRSELQTLAEAHSLIQELETSLCSMSSLPFDSNRTETVSGDDDSVVELLVQANSCESKSFDSGHESISSQTIPEEYGCNSESCPLPVEGDDVVNTMRSDSVELGSGLPALLEEMRTLETLTDVAQLDVSRGIASVRRLPRVTIKFHVRANPVLKYGHYISRREFQCSLTDCLAAYDNGGPLD